MSDTPSTIANVERLHALMDRDGLAAVVARSGTNFTYLAGFDYAGTLARHLDLSDSPRGVVAVWPRHGEPVLVLNRIAADRAERDAGVRRFEICDDYGESMWGRVAKVLLDLGLGAERLGIEKSVVSAAHFEELGAALPDADLADCGPTLHEVRWIKTDGEIALIREAARWLDEVYLNVLPSAKVGEPESALHARLIGACIERGANWAHGILNSSRNRVFYGGESSFTFAAGDVIRNDYVLWYQGYPGHQSRTAVIGEPSAKRQRDYRTIRDIYRATVDQVRPGVAASAVHAFATQAFADAGYPGRVAIAGHSVGPWWHQQPPFLVPSDHAPIEAGMVLALEPHVNEYHLQDMFLITEDGNELLSPLMSTDEMLVAEG